MINKYLINPSSIAIVGASNSLMKPGGGLVKNLIEGGYEKPIYPVNPKEKKIQGLKAYNKLDELPDTDLAILAISAEQCLSSVDYLSKNKATKAFIIISAGFAELGGQGQKIEQEIRLLAQNRELSIIGPNCIGVMNMFYKAIFVSPPPPLISDGVDFVSASGAMAVFLFETAAKHGLKFGSVFTVGNSTVIGVEEVLEYWDKEYISGVSSKIKMVYVEQIRTPKAFLMHIQSLRRKGCYVIVTKPGSSEAGNRAVLSHTGAIAGDGKAYKLLIQKAGAIECNSREELINTACILWQKELKGGNIAIITHAGGPAVLLADSLNKSGINVPILDETTQKELLNILNCGSSASNPVDMLATANKEQLATAIETCSGLDYIHGIVVIYGRTGLEDLFLTYKSLSEAVSKLDKPVYTIMPSVNAGQHEIEDYISAGNVTYFDEVVFARALDKVINKQKIFNSDLYFPENHSSLKNSSNIALDEASVYNRLKIANIPIVEPIFINSKDDMAGLKKIRFPAVAKVLGILHKTELGGVILNINSRDELLAAFDRLMGIPNSKGILIQEMVNGIELYVGGKYHENIGYSVHAGIGGIFIELFKDMVSGLAPIATEEAEHMLTNLKSKEIFSGYRNMPPVNRMEFARIIHSFSKIFMKYPDIREIDLNPLIAYGDKIVVVDARIII